MQDTFHRCTVRGRWESLLSELGLNVCRSSTVQNGCAPVTSPVPYDLDLARSTRQYCSSSAGLLISIGCCSARRSPEPHRLVLPTSLLLASPQGSSLDGLGIANNSSPLARLLGFQAEIVLGFSIFPEYGFTLRSVVDMRRRSE